MYVYTVELEILAGIKFGGLASTGINIKLADFNLVDSGAGIHCMQCQYLTLVNLIWQ